MDTPHQYPQQYHIPLLKIFLDYIKHKCLIFNHLHKTPEQETVFVLSAASVWGSHLGM